MFMGLVGPYARKTGAHTLMEFLELRFGKTVAYCGLAINLLFVGMFMLGQMKAVGVCVEHITGLDYRMAVLAGGAVLTVYCVLGGMFGISWNQCIQGVIMLAGIALPLAFVLRTLGVHAWWNPFFGYGNLAPALEQRGFFKLPFYGSLVVLPLACLAHIIVSCLTPPDPERALVDRWHGCPHAVETRYNSIALPILLSAAAVLLLAVAVL